MENGCALEKDCFWGNKHVRELLLKYRFEEHSACHKASCFRKDVNVDFSSPLCQIPLHTSMRTKEFKMKMKYCGIHLMGQQEKYVPSWLYQEDPWVASTSINIIHPS